MPDLQDRDMSPANRLHDVAVVGLGPSGLVAALALAHLGADVTAAGPVPPPSAARPADTRTAALLASSIDLLKALGVWEALLPHAAPLKAIRIIDASRSLIRAPDIEFAASELGLPAFGYNIANTVLVDALLARAKAVLPAVITASVTEIAVDREKAVLTLSEAAPVRARLLVGADGRGSICRKSAGIGVTERRYDQGAIATSFKHARPHGFVSIELHKEGGSVTTVPLPDPYTSALIWLGPPQEIAHLMLLDAAEFGADLYARLGGSLGVISEVGARAEFPVMGLMAERLAARRTVLVGDAAHSLPPIGAQGLNLGFRDAAALADCVAEALREGRDPGSEEVLEAYRRNRGPDVITRSFGVDVLSRSLLTSLPPLQAARGLVMQGLKAFSPLRRAVMRVGLTPPTELPTLMRPGAA
jgi:2-octaprenyl-6-methoxyphenol hydroxylase